jgi:NIPSNAP protein
MSKSKRIVSAALPVALLMVGFAAGRLTSAGASAHAQAGNRVFELRTYTTNEGKLPALQTRFRDHTTRLFTKHGMTNIGYWTPQDPKLSQNTLIYIIAHQSREAATKSWAAFRSDPDWQKAAAASEADGKILSKSPESVFMDPTDYSPIK